jgi:biofilm PGA synthesis N-glycosyltransferase PgaC
MPTYCIVSPVRDEILYAARTLDSVVAQTILPDLWVIVDDGSTDGTSALLREYEARYPFIKVVTRTNRGMRRVGGGVVEAFYEGWAIAQPMRFDFLSKLDLDLDLPRTYFADLLEIMAADPRLGTVSGKAYYPGHSNPEGRFDGELISENIGDDVSLGMAKFWRRECFEQIDGLIAQVLWDGIDCYKARMNGWKAYSTDRPSLRFIHLRPMGSSHKGIITGRQRWGSGHWIMGSLPLFVVVTSINRMRYRPYVTGGIAMLFGYLKAATQKTPQLQDKRFRRHLRRYQWALMLLGKDRAMRRFHENGAANWRSG